MHIFVSYRRDDAGGHAGRLSDDLVRRFGPGSVFMDVESITAGTDFLTAIAEAIGGADVMLVIIGPRWLGGDGADGRRRLDEPNDIVRFEIETALSSGSRVVPVLVGAASMPAELTLPPTISRLARLNAVEIADRRWRDDVESLIRVLGSERDEEATHQQTGADRTPRSGSPREDDPEHGRRRVGAWGILAAALILTVLTTVVALLAGRDDTPPNRPRSTTSLAGAVLGWDLSAGEVTISIDDLPSGATSDMAQGEGALWIDRGFSLLRIDASDGSFSTSSDGTSGTAGEAAGMAIVQGSVWRARGQELVEFSSASGEELQVLDAGLGDVSGGPGGGPRASDAIAAFDAVWVGYSDGALLRTTNPGSEATVAPVGSTVRQLAAGDAAIWAGADFESRVMKIDVATAEVIASVELTSGIDRIAIGGGQVWVLDTAGGVITPIDEESIRVGELIPTGSEPSDIAFGKGSLWLARGRVVVQIDPLTHQVVEQFDVGHPIARILVDDPANMLWLEIEQ